MSRSGRRNTAARKRSGFVCLAGGSIKCHHPKSTFRLIFACKEEWIAFLDGVEKALGTRLHQFGYRLNVVDGESVQSQQFGWFAFLFTIWAHGERVLADLYEHKVTPFPLFPLLFAFDEEEDRIFKMNGQSMQSSESEESPLPCPYKYPQCFMFCGLSIRTTSFIFKSWSDEFLGTTIWIHSGALLPVGVGRMMTLPSSLSSNENSPGDWANSFTLTTGSGCDVVKSPCVSQLWWKIILENKTNS